MRATRALIHLHHLRHNYRLLRRRAGPQGLICPAVKADAYGHGAVPVSRALQEEGADALALAAVEEARELREAGITLPLILLGLCLPEDYPELVRLGLEPFVSSLEQLEALASEAARQGQQLPVHLTLETGMGRVGFLPEELLPAARRTASAPFLELRGLATHFPQADGGSPEMTGSQTAALDAAREKLAAEGLEPPILHAANSGALLDRPDARFQMVRPGILLYGYYPSAGQERTLPVKPVMEFKSALVLVRTLPKGSPVSYGSTWRCPAPTRIGTVPAGYADGVNRLLSNQGSVLISGRRYPIRGRVCMDQFMVDLDHPLPAGKAAAQPAEPAKPPEDTLDKPLDYPPIGPGTPVTLFGPDPAGPNAEEVAELTGTIPYETLCAVSRRVPRIYRDAPAGTADSTGPA